MAGAALPTQEINTCLSPLRSVPLQECVAISEAHTCVDCLTRAC